MKISKLDLEPAAIDFLTSEGYEKLNEPQKFSVDVGILEGKSVLVSAPTASGKTLIAMLGILAHISKNKSKIIYLSPLRALAAEKFHEFKKLEKINLGRKIKVSMSTGDFDSSKWKLENSDILILTNEKMDSLMRTPQPWLEKIGLVIVDEIHLLGDDSRGPTLEIVLTRIKSGLVGKKPQIIGLSATITNSLEISRWLNCEHVHSIWRPITLSECVFDNDENKVINESRKKYKPKLDDKVSSTVGLGLDSVINGGQSLLFANTRASAAKLAVDSASVIKPLLSSEEKIHLSNVSKKILANNEHTELVKKLSIVVEQGVGFHHAGLNPYCRNIIENEFRDRNVKLISATPTLAAGVNLPARRVVISNITRYTIHGPNTPISVLEYKQLCGRAGRPQFDKTGESIIITPKQGFMTTDDVLEKYVDGIPEPIKSKLNNPKSIRIHLLSLIVSSIEITDKKINNFFSQTFAAMDDDENSIKMFLENAKMILLDEQFITEKNGTYTSTSFGNITSQQYIDPLTAISFRKEITDITEGRKHTLGFLHLITDCEEFFPKINLRNKDRSITEQLIENNSHVLIKPLEPEDCSRSLLALWSWIREETEVSLSKNYNIESGDMFRIKETALWLCNALKEISRNIGRKQKLVNELDKLHTRIYLGGKEELIKLADINGVGRVRARMLYKNGYKNKAALKKAPVEKLAEIDKIGMTIAKSIKSQVEKVR